MRMQVSDDSGSIKVMIFNEKMDAFKSNYRVKANDIVLVYGTKFEDVIFEVFCPFKEIVLKILIPLLLQKL